MNRVSRRQFLGGAAGAAVAIGLPLRAFAAGSKFKVGVISDEISNDFDHACDVIKNKYGLHYLELRGAWGKNAQDFTDAQIAEAQKILKKYELTVTDISSPLFKVNWPGAPVSADGTKEDTHGASDVTFKKQDDVLRRSIELAKQFGTDKVRCFDFWRIKDVTPYRKAINEKLQEAAEFAGKQGILLVLENEFACNTATGREAAATLAGVPSKHLALNWDPGNAVMRGEVDAYPGGWNEIPKERIRHCHVKNAVKGANDKTEWSPVDVGIIDWVAQFKAMKALGYSDAVNLETHWHGGGTPEESTNRSWEGMKKNLIAAGCL